MTEIPPLEPAITHRPAQPYAGIRRVVTMDTIPEIADRIPEVFGWLAARGIPPAGGPFLRYRVIDMARGLEIDAGVPVATPVTGDGEVFADTLPAGRYVTAVHTGHPAQLAQATAALLDWAKQRGLVWDSAPGEGGERWGCRLEIYHTNPAEEPDMNKWETELAFRLS